MPPQQPSLLYIDMAHLAQTIKERKHEVFYEARHSGGYFHRVWGVHPLADAAGKKSRRIELIRFSKRQLLVEGVAESLRLPRFMLPLNFLISQWRLARLLRRIVLKNNVSVIGSSDPVYAGLLALIVKKLTRRPLAVRIYSNNDELYQASGTLAMPRLIPFWWLEKRVVRFVLSRADLVIGANRNYLNWAIANGARNQTAIVPNARYIERFHFVEPAQRPEGRHVFESRGIPCDRPTMLYVGRLLELKHPEDAVRAMAHAIKRRPEAIGVLAGTGRMREELEQLIRELGMEGRIFLAGHVDQEEISLILPHCITISPLTGMALIESGLAGSPIVAYDRDWQAEFISDGEDGFLVAFRDHETMGERAAELIGHPERARRFSEKIRERALAFASPEKIRELEAGIFDRLLKRHDGAAVLRAAPAARQDVATR